VFVGVLMLVGVLVLVFLGVLVVFMVFVLVLLVRHGVLLRQIRNDNDIS
jgi:hypothetical protein